MLWLNTLSSWSAWILRVAQLPFFINFFWSMRSGEAVDRNPWHATTLEWQAPSPPPHGNFDHPPVVYRGPYDYSPARLRRRLRSADAGGLTDGS